MEKQLRVYERTIEMPPARKMKYLRALSLNTIKNKKINEKIIKETMNLSYEKNKIAIYVEIFLGLAEVAYREEEGREEAAKLVIEYMPGAIKYLYSQPDMEAMHIEIFFKKMEMIIEKYGVSTRRLHQEKFKYYVSNGLWEQSFKSFSKWMREDMDKYSASIGEEEADRAYYYYLIGEGETGDYIQENVTNGVLRAKGLKTDSIPRVLKYKLEKDLLEEASKAAKTIYKMTQRKQKNLYLNAEMMKIMTLKNKMAAFDIWRKEYKNFKESENEYDRFHYGVATYMLYRSFQNDEKITKHSIKMKKIIDKMYDIQEAYDARNKNTFFLEEILFWENLTVTYDSVKEK